MQLLPIIYKNSSRALKPVKRHRYFEGRGGGIVVEGEAVVAPELTHPFAAAVDSEILGPIAGNRGIRIGYRLRTLHLVGADSDSAAADLFKAAVIPEFDGFEVALPLLYRGEDAVALDSAGNHPPLADDLAGSFGIAEAGTDADRRRQRDDEFFNNCEQFHFEAN